MQKHTCLERKMGKGHGIWMGISGVLARPRVPKMPWDPERALENTIHV
jgi:hypothetical protein